MQYTFTLIKGKKMESGDSFVNVYLRLWLTCHLMSAICCWRSQEWALHSPGPVGFVYLEFSWMHAPFVFSSIQFYPPVALAVLFYLEFAWGCAPPPQTGGAWHTLPAVGELLLSKHTGGGGATLAFSCRLEYLQFTWGSAPPPLFSAQGSSPSVLHVFFFQLLVYYSVVFSFFPGRGQSVQGAIWFVHGSTTWCLFAHLVVSWAG
jgi:hypothetical protein